MNREIFVKIINRTQTIVKIRVISLILRVSKLNEDFLMYMDH